MTDPGGAGADPLARLLAARERSPRLVIGLLSGTSADGTDAALCAISGSGALAMISAKRSAASDSASALRVGSRSITLQPS